MKLPCRRTMFAGNVERLIERWCGVNPALIAYTLAGLASAALPPLASAQTVSVPETVVISARPPDPVGNAAFSTVLIDPNQLQTTPKLDAALRQVPGISNFRDISTLAAYPARIGVSLRSLIAPQNTARALGNSGRR